MAVNLEKSREEQLLREIPDVVSLRSVLYVGAKPGRLQMVDLLRRSGAAIDAVEAWPANYAELVRWNTDARVFRRIFGADIADPRVGPLEPYEAVFFWHGPEHLSREVLPGALANLERFASRLVVLASPWGFYKQGAVGGNPFERHLSHLYPEDLEAFGYRTSTLGRPDRVGSNLLAWKRIGRKEP